MNEQKKAEAIDKIASVLWSVHWDARRVFGHDDNGIEPEDEEGLNIEYKAEAARILNIAEKLFGD